MNKNKDAQVIARSMSTDGLRKGFADLMLGPFDELGVQLVAIESDGVSSTWIPDESEIHDVLVRGPGALDETELRAWLSEPQALMLLYFALRADPALAVGWQRVIAGHGAEIAKVDGVDLAKLAALPVTAMPGCDPGGEPRWELGQLLRSVTLLPGSKHVQLGGKHVRVEITSTPDRSRAVDIRCRALREPSANWASMPILAAPVVSTAPILAQGVACEDLDTNGRARFSLPAKEAAYRIIASGTFRVVRIPQDSRHADDGPVVSFDGGVRTHIGFQGSVWTAHAEALKGGRRVAYAVRRRRPDAAAAILHFGEFDLGRDGHGQLLEPPGLRGKGDRDDELIMCVLPDEA